MKAYAQPIKRLISELSKLPGIGEKTATRLANHILKAQDEDVRKLAESIIDVKKKIKLCRTCLNLTEADVCHICHDKSRDQGIICVVEEPDAMAAIEESGGYHGTYHVLHGALAPLDGVGPENLHLNELMKRINGGGIKEVIIATNPDVHGEATALLIIKMLKGKNIKVTRIATGVPMGGDLKYVDKMTLSKSLEFRRGM
ncbi:MAG TPA: recombination mediator RecR [Smithellaceae bacterium]|nr:recombination mediator RecR [Smithellaceae bacterium]HRS89339.1 recombination mediator RecR [Smithellaceae bacterium]HRV26829.1 recombination mediator RecR [Smithellaceae bacterium]